MMTIKEALAFSAIWFGSFFFLGWAAEHEHHEMLLRKDAAYSHVTCVIHDLECYVSRVN